MCINVNEISTFSGTVKRETYMINHRFNCNEGYLVYLLTISVVSLAGY